MPNSAVGDEIGADATSVAAGSSNSSALSGTPSDVPRGIDDSRSATANDASSTGSDAISSNSESPTITSELYSPIISDATPDKIVPGAQYAANEIGPVVKTGNSEVDATSQKLVDTLASVVDKVPGGSGPLYGVAVHLEFANAVRALDLPGIGFAGVEQSFDLDGLVDYGAAGSVRTDVTMWGINASGEFRPLAIWDVKTGAAQLRPSRAEQLRQIVGVGDEVPIIVIRARGLFTENKWADRRGFLV